MLGKTGSCAQFSLPIGCLLSRKTIRQMVAYARHEEAFSRQDNLIGIVILKSIVCHKKGPLNKDRKSDKGYRVLFNAVVHVPSISITT